MKWIKVDIDGTGDRWRLAVLRHESPEYKEPVYYFPVEDYAELECEFALCEMREVMTPDDVEEQMECLHGQYMEESSRHD